MSKIYIQVSTENELPKENGYYFTDCGRCEFKATSEICNLEWELYDWWLKPAQEFDFEREFTEEQPDTFTALNFIQWLKLNSFKIIKNTKRPIV